MEVIVTTLIKFTRIYTRDQYNTVRGRCETTNLSQQIRQLEIYLNYWISKSGEGVEIECEIRIDPNWQPINIDGGR